MDDKAPSTKQYDKEMLQKQKQNLIKQSLNRLNNERENKITRDLDSYTWQEPVEK